MKCFICDFENPEDANFCCNCGASIADTTAIEQVRAGVQQRIDDFVATQQRELKLVEREALDRIQEDAVRRGKTFTYVLGVPIAMFLLVLSVLGVQNLSDIRTISSEASSELKALKKVREGVMINLAEAKKALTQANIGLSNLQKKLEVAEDKFNELSTANKTAVEASKTSNDILGQLKELGAKLRTELQVAKNSTQNLQNLAINAQYKIWVQVHPGEPSVESFLQLLREVLGKQSFVVKADDVLWLKVDQTEILYFDDGDKERAKIIQEALQLSGVLKTEIRKEDVPSRSYEIQIKVGQIPKTEGV